MLDDQAFRFLMVALQKGFVTESQASEACRISDEEEGSKPVSFVLMDLGYITPEGFDEVISEIMGPVSESEPEIPTQPDVDEEELTRIIEDGEQLAGEGKYTLAFQKFDRALAEQPEHEEARWMRAQARVDKRKYEEALEDYTALLGTTQKTSEAYNRRGVVLAKLGRVEEAIADQKASIEADDTNHKAYFDLATSHHARKELEEAIAAYDAAIRLKPDYVEAFNNRGIAQVMSRDLEGAQESWKQALEIDGKRRTIQLNMMSLMGQVKKKLK
ncbi:MAG: tetratricopeptide repeat protein [Planctomycetota bacterium]|nr:tetratricopeptide repeat protein [Planctomycetota bacterium]